ncbi:hypothetical protein HDU67_003172 [Dinochytrium kinnereticum]|nr:hypothetical protein HDU67_003172 [Dinochytrium kinnereticum]
MSVVDSLVEGFRLEDFDGSDLGFTAAGIETQDMQATVAPGLKSISNDLCGGGPPTLLFPTSLFGGAQFAPLGPNEKGIHSQLKSLSASIEMIRRRLDGESENSMGLEALRQLVLEQDERIRRLETETAGFRDYLKRLESLEKRISNGLDSVVSEPKPSACLTEESVKTCTNVKKILTTPTPMVTRKTSKAHQASVSTPAPPPASPAPLPEAVHPTLTTQTTAGELDQKVPIPDEEEMKVTAWPNLIQRRFTGVISHFTANEKKRIDDFARALFATNFPDKKPVEAVPNRGKNPKIGLPECLEAPFLTQIEQWMASGMFAVVTYNNHLSPKLLTPPGILPAQGALHASAALSSFAALNTSKVLKSPKASAAAAAAETNFMEGITSLSSSRKRRVERAKYDEELPPPKKIATKSYDQRNVSKTPNKKKKEVIEDVARVSSRRRTISSRCPRNSGSPTPETPAKVENLPTLPPPTSVVPPNPAPKDCGAVTTQSPSSAQSSLPDLPNLSFEPTTSTTALQPVREASPIPSVFPAKDTTPIPRASPAAEIASAPPAHPVPDAAPIPPTLSVPDAEPIPSASPAAPDQRDITTAIPIHQQPQIFEPSPLESRPEQCDVCQTPNTSKFFAHPSGEGALLCVACFRGQCWKPRANNAEKPNAGDSVVGVPEPSKKDTTGDEASATGRTDGMEIMRAPAASPAVVDRFAFKLDPGVLSSMTVAIVPATPASSLVGNPYTDLVTRRIPNYADMKSEHKMAIKRMVLIWMKRTMGEEAMEKFKFELRPGVSRRHVPLDLETTFLEWVDTDVVPKVRRFL